MLWYYQSKWLGAGNFMCWSFQNELFSVWYCRGAGFVSWPYKCSALLLRCRPPLPSEKETTLIFQGPWPESQGRNLEVDCLVFALLPRWALGGDSARAKDAQGKPTQSHISPWILEYTKRSGGGCWVYVADNRDQLGVAGITVPTQHHGQTQPEGGLTPNHPSQIHICISMRTYVSIYIYIYIYTYIYIYIHR